MRWESEACICVLYSIGNRVGGEGECVGGGSFCLENKSFIKNILLFLKLKKYFPFFFFEGNYTRVC